MEVKTMLLCCDSTDIPVLVDARLSALVSTEWG
jgi:hypothetical protein